MNNIPNLTEHKAVKLFNEKFGQDKITRFLKVREEFLELSDAFSEFIITGNDEHLRNEICDLQATVTHFASLFDLYQKQMLHTAIDKVKTRETDPGYKRYPNLKSIRKMGVIGGIGSISSFESQIELLKYHLENDNKELIICEGSFEDVKCKDDIFSNLEKMKQIEMEIKAPMPLMSDCKIETNFEVREPKPWDRKEMNRHKTSYKKKRRK